MRAGAFWSSAEETAFVHFLVDNKAEAGDGGNFKTATYQRAITHLASLRERGTVKTVKGLRNKWTAFRKIYRIICAIQLVSGWVWDNSTGASITVDSASSWDDYVKKHPGAKPFRNKGWKHFANVALIMPSTTVGSNVFHPTSVMNGFFDRSLSPEPNTQSSMDNQETEDSDNEETPAIQSLVPAKRVREPATPIRSASKCFRGSQGAAALQSMSESLAGFNTAFTAALVPPSAAIAPSPIRRTQAVTAVQDLEADWLSVTEQVAFIDFLRNDPTAADVYSALTKPEIHREWARTQLEKLGIIVLASTSH